MQLIPLVEILFRIASFVILARVILSWIPSAQYHAVSQWIFRITEPVLEPIRRVIPTGSIGLDISPIIALLLLRVLQFFVIRVLLAF